MHACSCVLSIEVVPFSCFVYNLFVGDVNSWMRLSTKNRANRAPWNIMISQYIEYLFPWARKVQDEHVVFVSSICHFICLLIPLFAHLSIYIYFTQNAKYKDNLGVADTWVISDSESGAVWLKILDIDIFASHGLCCHKEHPYYTNKSYVTQNWKMGKFWSITWLCFHWCSIVFVLSVCLICLSSALNQVLIFEPL